MRSRFILSSEFLVAFSIISFQPLRGKSEKKGLFQGNTNQSTPPIICYFPLCCLLVFRIYFIHHQIFGLLVDFITIIMLQKILVAFSLFFGFALCDKVCTNTGVQSHTARYAESFSSKNSSRSDQTLVRLRLNPGARSNSIPRKILREEEHEGSYWNILKLGSEIKRPGRIGADFLKEISLHDVVLFGQGSIHAEAQQTNLEYLLMLDVDRLVWSFRKTAELETPDEAYGGWEAPDVELRGHFVGHYLSASALMWASTHNATLRKKMSSLVSALSECQNKIGTGYLSAFPSELFDRFEELEEVWAPYYTIHKILAGLLDQYTLAGNDLALNMTKWMAEYFYDRVQRLISKHTIERHWLSLNEETGGMNDVLYRLHIITGDPQHLTLAHLFDKPCFLGLLAVEADDISGFHSNTHIPIVIGAQQRYEITGEPLYKDIGTFFMNIINSSHSYVTGGTSVGEFWSDPNRLGETLETENQESCTTYNMLKVSRHLFRWTKDVAYADYYERALTNGVLGIQRGREPGVMIYMLPLHPGGSKARSYHGWGTKFNSFWCCYGTGIESFSKLGDSIYFEEEGDVPRLYVVQYINSLLLWRSGKLRLTQRIKPVVSWDQKLQVVVAITSTSGSEGKSSTLNLRIPHWMHSNGSQASVNDEVLALPPPGNFLSITRSWTSGDQISLDLRMSLRAEAIKDDRPEYASVRAFLYGPYLLAGLSSGDWEVKVKFDSLSDWMTPVPSEYNSQLITLSQEFNNSTYVLTNSEQGIKTEALPEAGTDSAIRATFRLIVKNSEPGTSAIGKLVMLEPFDYPGTVVLHHGKGKSLGISDASFVGDQSSDFHLVPGLDGENGSVSLESDSLKGCYVYSDLSYYGPAGSVSNSNVSVKLECSTDTSDDAGFVRATSFVMQRGMSEYHPISFVAKGVQRNFVLAPLYSFRDESYTVYFNTSML